MIWVQFIIMPHQFHTYMKDNLLLSKQWEVVTDISIDVLGTKYMLSNRKNEN